MKFETYFRLSSYAMIAVATAALVLAGALQPFLALLFSVVLILGWLFEGRSWQLSERTGLALVLLSLPIFYLDWTYLELPGTEGHISATKALVGAIAHLIVFLSAIKLLQVKADRDWVFLYLISFFEVLLAAGLSFNPIFLGSLTAYFIVSLSTVIAFEIHKARRNLATVETRLLVPPDSVVFRRWAQNRKRRTSVEVKRLPLLAVGLLLLILAFALPLFLVAPRSGAAAFTRGGAAVTNFVGFSENVTLGELGALKQNDQVIMHVRIEESAAGTPHELRWRGIALDEFTGQGWKKSNDARRVEQKTSERGFYQLGTTEALHRLTTQTVFLEPLDTPAVFAAPRVVALQGSFPYIRVDSEGGIQSRRHEFDRVIYKAISDTTEPDPGLLRHDRGAYTPLLERYRQYPDTLDPHIGSLARDIIVNKHARNLYDAAAAIERHLREGYGYTLEMKATGPDPLADFLFRVREGHCEYFATAMAVMLRTQGVATRVVNGFLPGEFNEAAGAYTVRQSDAHSWVEVYFPETNSWVSFDPTPAAGRVEPRRSGLRAFFGKYAEAFELIWFQYVVGYDRQEQRSLAASLTSSLFQYRNSLGEELSSWKQMWPQVVSRGLYLVIAVGLFVMLFGLLRRIRKLGWRRALELKKEFEPQRQAIDFYEQMIALLEQQGLRRQPNQTPLEFAASTGLPPTLTVTRAYNRVRYGEEQLSAADLRQIEEILTALGS